MIETSSDLIPSPISGETTDNAVDAQLSAPLPGHFGPYGGKFVPETIMVALRELECVYEEAKHDAAFRDELSALLRDFAGRPTPLFYAERLTEHFGGARLFPTREALLHLGADTTH